MIHTQTQSRNVSEAQRLSLPLPLRVRILSKIMYRFRYKGSKFGQEMIYNSFLLGFSSVSPLFGYQDAVVASVIYEKNHNKRSVREGGVLIFG